MRTRRIEWLRFLSLATLSASCSLLFDTASGEYGSDAASLVDANPLDRDGAGPCPDPSVPGLLVLDDFECGALGDTWMTSVTSATGNSCRISTEQAKDSQHSLECKTPGGLNDRAALYIDVPATDNIRVQMDVYFATPPPQYMTFLQTLYLDLITPHALVSMNYLEEPGSPGKISFYSEDPRYEQNGEFMVDQNQWMHIDFNLRLADTDGLISFDTDVAGMSTLTGDTLNAAGELITRLEIGIVDASTSTVPQQLFIDNVQATRAQR